MTHTPATQVLVARQTDRSLRGLMRYFLTLGASGFGGPIALVGYMQRDLVEQRDWYSEQEFAQGLAVAQMMPGPLAAQVAMWLGYLHAGVRGAIAVTIPFVAAPFLVVTAIAALYAQYQGLPPARNARFACQRKRRARCHRLSLWTRSISRQLRVASLESRALVRRGALRRWRWS